MRLLRIISSLDAAIGGPAEGIRAITPALAAMGHTTTCVTLDAPGVVTEGHVKQATTVCLGPRRGGYSYSNRLIPWLRQHGPHFDAVLVHGLWQFPGYAARRALRSLRVPYFVFPHGMLDPWFQHAYPLKHLKKYLYWMLVERRVLRDAAAVLFTCEEERRLAPVSFPRFQCTEATVAYGTAPPSAGRASGSNLAIAPNLPPLDHSRYFLYLGRIHPKKGVDLLLQAYGQLGRSATTDLQRKAFPALVVAGPCADAALLARLKRLASGLPHPCKVYWTGMLRGEQKWTVLKGAELFVLPSHQENFGIAVAEALACGVPVAITNKVNIWREIEADGAGLVENDDLPGVMRLLERWMALEEPARAELRSAATLTFAQRYEINRVAESLIETVRRYGGGERTVDGRRGTVDGRR